MNPVIRELILKDWRLHKPHLLFTVGAEVLALAAVMLRTETAVVVGTVCFFTALIVAGCLLVGSNILNERKRQTLPFVMSLPVSPVQYSAAKLVATVGIFLVMWLPMAAVIVWLIEVKGMFPQGILPVALILLTLPFVGFTIVTAANLVGETEGWNMAAVVVCNSSYGFSWYFVLKVPAFTNYWGGNVAVWNSTAVSVLGGEFALAAVTLALTFYLQSRKRDFI
jgi:ABC-2 type transport system permease protein